MISKEKKTAIIKEYARTEGDTAKYIYTKFCNIFC